MKIKVIARGIHGATGELPIGAEFEISGQIPAGWAELVEVIHEPAPEAKLITNPRKAKG